MTSNSSRRADIDWTRGVAVLLMIGAHVADAWTRPAVRASAVFRDVTILGGFAAPLFLWIAGLAAVLTATRAAERSGNRAQAAAAIARRGLEIFILAFLFRLQAFVISPGSHPIALFRVDILNIMGPALAAAAVVWAASPTTWRQATLFGVLAAVIAMATPLVRTASAVEWLPTWMEWYVRPAGEHTTFTLFPWAAFLMAGAACGVVIAAVRSESSDRLVRVGFALAGAALVAIGFWTASRPSMYRSASFWTSSPTWFAIRVGILMLAFALISTVEALARRAGVALQPLERLGRHSLFIYWIHVELVYGYATWSLRQRLPLWGLAIAYVVFCTLMYFAIDLRDRIAGSSWRRAWTLRPQA